MGAFHSYDIRGIYNVDFDKDTVYKVGFFLPELLKADKVLVGRDCRVSSDEIHEYLLKGITDAGADVYDLGLSTTPMVYFGTARYGFSASVQITASHNPKEYNGMKVSGKNALPVGYDNGLGQIKKWIDDNKPVVPSSVRGKIYDKNIKEEYLSYLKQYMGDLSGLKISFDLSNGMACLVARELFGDNHSYIYDNLDGTFPNHEPNPLVAGNLVSLQNLVRTEKSDIGVIYDGDADRVMFVDENANFISPDLIIALLSLYFVKEKGLKGVVLQDIRSSKAIAEFLEPLGCKVETWKVGRANAALKLREIDGLWGGELAGHYYFKDFFYSDSGLLASVLVLRIVASLKKDGISFGQIMDKITGYENSGEINFKLDDKQGAMDAVKSYFTEKENPSAFLDFDGYRVEFEKWWFNIRPSNTEPYLRFICEACSKELLLEKIEETKEILIKKFGAKV